MRIINATIITVLTLVLLALATNWEVLDPMSMGRMDSMAALDDAGIFYMFGGSDLSGYFQSAEKYEEGAGWSAIADMPAPLAQADAAFLDGKIYVAGGYNGTAFVKKLYVYDIASDSWSTAADMPQYRYSYSLDEIDGKLYLVGGYDDSDISQSNCWQYDPAQNKWTAKEPSLQRRGDHGSAVLDGKLYVFGGIENIEPYAQLLDTAEVYDPQSDTWASIAALPLFFHSGSSGIVDGAVWACHGIQGFDVSGDCYKYEPIGDEWQTAVNATQARYNTASASSPLYVAGGMIVTQQGGEVTDLVERIGEPPVDDDTTDDDTVDDDTVDDDVSDDDQTDDDIADDDDQADDDVVDDDVADDDDDDDDDGCGC